METLSRLMAAHHRAIRGSGCNGLVKCKLTGFIRVYRDERSGVLLICCWLIERLLTFTLHCLPWLSCYVNLCFCLPPTAGPSCDATAHKHCFFFSFLFVCFNEKAVLKVVKAMWPFFVGFVFLRAASLAHIFNDVDCVYFSPCTRDSTLFSRNPVTFFFFAYCVRNFQPIRTQRE